MLGWCALGSATGGKHVSAISHSSIYPIENHTSGDRDRSLKESAPSRLRNRIFYVSDLNQDASRTFVFSQPESPLARCLKAFRTNYLPEFTLALYSVAQPEVALFFRTYTNVSALSARSYQLYQNAHIFRLERSFSSAPTVHQLDICIQKR